MKWFTLLFGIACSENFKQQGDDVDAIGDSANPDLEDTAQGNDSGTLPEDICLTGPEAENISLRAECEYVPESNGMPFSAKIDWSMGHEMTDPTTGQVIPAHSFDPMPLYSSVFQAPAVGQMTDDNNDGYRDRKDIPDIAVIMGDEMDETQDWSVLRLISGNGSVVHDSVDWLNHNGTDYAPSLFSGLAIADIDGDYRIEIVTVVTQPDQVTCSPAAYEVSLSGQLSLESVSDETVFCNVPGTAVHASHAPSIADIDDDGDLEIVLGDLVFNNDLTLRFEGGAGKGWNHSSLNTGGYWNSGYHSFAYDVDGDGAEMEIVAGSTVYNANGSVYCELGSNHTGSWVSAEDGYPAIADVLNLNGQGAGIPEIVITGNKKVSLYNAVPDAQNRCVEINSISNNPLDDPIIGPQSSAIHSDCDESRPSFGGQPTIADFNGDGKREIGVAGACWYTIYAVDQSDGMLSIYAMNPTRDWSSASTGSTVFDFDGDGKSEVVFSDEDALYVWGIDTNNGLDPWERFIDYLVDQNHKSWTIHEYPLVADVDGDGKAEILVVNSARPSHLDKYGIYALGAADDNWVSARQWWNQHAYYVSNIDNDGVVGFADPNYAPFSPVDINGFRQQAPGEFGALAAPNLSLYALPACQEDCGDITVWLQVNNDAAYISSSAGLHLSLYGEANGMRTLIQSQQLAWMVDPGERSEGIAFIVSNWDAYDRLIAVVDDPAFGPESWGGAKECDETDNEIVISLDDVCP